MLSSLIFEWFPNGFCLHSDYPLSASPTKPRVISLKPQSDLLLHFPLPLAKNPSSDPLQPLGLFFPSDPSCHSPCVHSLWSLSCPYHPRLPLSPTCFSRDHAALSRLAIVLSHPVESLLNPQCQCSCLLLPLLRSCFSRVQLCDPIDGGPPGSPVPGILQARILEWVAISFSLESS